MKHYVLKIIEAVGPVARSNATRERMSGQYVKSFDPEAYEGRGLVDGTFDPAEARHFKTPIQAIAFYNQRSKTRPTRPDGRPNCPLTAFTVMVDEYDDGVEQPTVTYYRVPGRSASKSR